MADLDTKTKLLGLLDLGRREELAFWNGLSEGEQNASGTQDHWSAKDLLAHIAFWESRLSHSMSAWSRGEMTIEREDIDELNDRSFDLNSALPPAQIIADWKGAYNALLAEVSRLTEEELNRVGVIRWYNQRTIAASVAGNAFSHPQSHLAAHYLERGNFLEGKRIQEQTAQALIDFDSSDTMRGLAWYNLACFHALNSEPARAIQLLRDAFPLRPDLVEFSKKDSDLTSLRDLPDFKALYTS